MNCSNCAAPLTPNRQGGYAPCDHCGTHFVPGRPAGDLDQDLEQVEQWWKSKRRPFMRKSSHGKLHPPENHSRFLKLMNVGLGLAVAFVAVAIYWRWAWLGYAGLFLIPILISLPAALFHARVQWRYQQYQRLQREYEVRKSAIINRYAPRG
jgi:hypothetical protein